MDQENGNGSTRLIATRPVLNVTEVEKAKQKIDVSNPLILADKETGKADLIVDSTQLGDGSNNLVFKAYDVETEEVVAVKIPIRQGETTAEYELFSGLEHPCLPKYDETKSYNLVPGPGFDLQEANTKRHELGLILEHEVPVVRMELIEGPNLGDVVIDHDPDLIYSMIPTTITQLASVVDYLAENGIYHRDIPRNVLIAKDYLKLVDYGLCNKFYKFNEDDKVGQIPYSPPEATNTNWDKMGLSSEVFTVAYAAYQMLTRGAAPYGNEPVQDTIHDAETYAALPPLWSDKGLTETPYESLVSKEVATARLSTEQIANLDKVFKKALAFKPENRYQTATEFCNEFLKAFGGN